MKPEKNGSEGIFATTPFLKGWHIKTGKLCGLLILSMIFVSGCNKNDHEKKPQSAVPVRTLTIAFEPISVKRKYTGVIKSRYESDIGFRVPGKIIERLVNIGDSVHSGQILARLDVTDYRLSLEAQQAELAAAKSSLDQASAAEERYKTLKNKGWVAQAALDIRVSSAAEARSRVERAEKALLVQRNQVDYTELRADHNGVISALSMEVGQVVTTGQVVARVARIDQLEAVVTVPEHDLNTIKSAQAHVDLWPAIGKTYVAKLREISPEADSISRTFDVRFSITEADQNVRLGKTASLVVNSDSLKSIATLPLSAVMNDAKGPMVWIVKTKGADKNTVAELERRPIVIHAYTQDAVQIASGLSDGELVVTLGVHTLDTSLPVRVVENITPVNVSMKNTDQSLLISQ